MKFWFFHLLFLCFSFSLFGQIQKEKGRMLEAGTMFGVTSYSGDLSENAITLKEVRPGYGFFVRYHFNNQFAIKAHIYSGAISGDDAGTSRAARTLRFGSSIFESAVGGEYYFFAKERRSTTGIFRPRVNPYLYAGIGFTKGDPRAEYYGTQANTYLKVPIPEEGLKNRFILAPVSLGVRAELLEWLVVGGELGFRPVFSDDLDGVKVNADPTDNDWYYFGGVTLSVILGRAGE